MKKILESILHAGILCTSKEVLRRLKGGKYSCNGLLINNEEDFRVFREIKKRKTPTVLDGKNEMIIVSTPYGKIKAPANHISWLSPVLRDKDLMYGKLEVKGKIVLDVGGYIGDTALYFASRGAKKVYVYEPVKMFYELLIQNLKMNHMEHVAAINEGIWYDNGITSVSIEGPRTGLRDLLFEKNAGSETIKLVSIEKVAESIRKENPDEKLVMKMDCMGCEYSLIRPECSIINEFSQHIVKIYGPPKPIVWKMHKCKFKSSKIMTNIYYFNRV